MRRTHLSEEAGARAEDGSALIVTLALVLALTILVAATQWQVIHDLKVSKTERDFERALQMAESGANAYLNMLAKGLAPGNPLVPQQYVLPSILSPQEFKQQVKNKTIPPSHLVYYPPGQTRQGDFAAHLGTPGTSADIIAYGWSNGIVRRVRIHSDIYSIFDWVAIWGINPGTGNQDYAWKFSGNVDVIGACGAEGKLLYSGANVRIWDGPLVWANKSYAPPYNNPDIAPIANSGPNIPPGHPGTADHVHPIANPVYKHYVRKLGFPTADEAANEESGSNMGVAYFKTHNHNATGLRYLVRHTTTGVIRELNDPTKPYTVMKNNDWRLDGEFNPNKKDLENLGMTDEEEFYGIRAYPGQYYFEQIDMTNQSRLFLRTFKDSERPPLLANGELETVVVNDVGNPNPGESENQNVRFWIGTTGGKDPDTTFDVNTVMEYPFWASRFRVFIASTGTITVRGRNTNPPPPFRVNMLCYNKDASGKGYGHIHFQSATYLFGSLIAWMVDAVGGCIVEKQQPELGPSNPLAYNAVDWRELE